jgi:hypothetical protein
MIHFVDVVDARDEIDVIDRGCNKQAAGPAEGRAPATPGPVGCMRCDGTGLPSARHGAKVSMADLLYRNCGPGATNPPAPTRF